MKTVERGCLEGTGNTITEAKASLNAKLDAALAGSYDPHMITYGAYTAFIYRSPHGWQYRLIHSEHPEPGIVRIWSCSSPRDTLEECLQDAAFHVIDVGADPDAFHDEADIPAFLTDRPRRWTVLTNQRFRRAFRWASENAPDGITENHRLHEWACHHSHEERFA